jgi:hypothetical protein
MSQKLEKTTKSGNLVKVGKIKSSRKIKESLDDQYE